MLSAERMLFLVLLPWGTRVLLVSHLERRGHAGCESGSSHRMSHLIVLCLFPHPWKGGLAICRLSTGSGGDSTGLSSSRRLARLGVITWSPRQQERASFNVQMVLEAQLHHVCCGPLAKDRLTVELSICVTGDYQCVDTGGRIGVYFCSCANVSFRG